jgi:hypothetical protein
MKITKETLSKVYKSEQRNDPSGYTLIENLFVDSSGFGSTGEMALTTEEMEIKLFDFCGEHGSIYTFITSSGQFQVNIGVYTKDKTNNFKTFAKHKANLKYDNKFVYSYDTKVAEIVGNTLNLSSWSVGGKSKSPTTTRHINYAVDQLNLTLIN